MTVVESLKDVRRTALHFISSVTRGKYLVTAVSRVQDNALTLLF